MHQVVVSLGIVRGPLWLWDNTRGTPLEHKRTEQKGKPTVKYVIKPFCLWEILSSFLLVIWWVLVLALCGGGHGGFMLFPLKKICLVMSSSGAISPSELAVYMTWPEQSNEEPTVPYRHFILKKVFCGSHCQSNGSGDQGLKEMISETHSHWRHSL